MADLTQSRLKEVLNYETYSGRWMWLARTSDKIQIGDEAGYINRALGYRYIRIDGKMYRAARLAVLYMTGNWPTHHVDHINGVRDDDRWINLRPATRRQNQRNQGRRKNNTSGYKGVSWHELAGKYVARIKDDDGVYRCLGYFSNPAEAHAEYVAAATKLHGEFANGG